ncbi:hypothetical protein ACQP1K_28510 [Sphaerimonospora sp. CA-214678]|uniref:hypothetical protein n=1 Tax=Sphaerimonospora sp. CA-214678 TaxID=3240029 RepID=UPI003D8BAC7D
MRQVTRPARRPYPRLTLNADGARHPLTNFLAVTTLILGIAAFVTGFIVNSHVFASWVGVIGFWGGFYVQYISVTTAQRCLIIAGIVMSFVGMALGIAHGGFVPGV